ncbi:MAG: cupin protein [Thermoleophilia bacterium]|nr:cupin protein [Thermoleophilia bacterium]
MTDFTLRNVADIEDMAPKFGQGEFFEARFATKPLGCEQTGLLHITVKPNQASPFAHRHVEQEELYYVLDGSGELLIGETVQPIRAGDVVRITPSVVRSLRAGDTGVTVLCFGAPAMSGGSNDAKMVEADWPEDA